MRPQLDCPPPSARPAPEGPRPSVAAPRSRATARTALHRPLLRALLVGALLGVASGCDTSLGPPPPDADDVTDGEGASGDASPADGPQCGDYCTLVAETEACRGARSQYASFDVCMNTCNSFAGWAPGGFQDGQGNTIGCRINAVNLAVQDEASADRHCAAAGPSGGNVCGSWCDVYCALMERNCADVPGVHVDEATCRAACPGFSTAGRANDFDGDTVQCRITHLTLAGNPLPGQDRLHCPHGAIDAARPCVGPPPASDE